MHSSATPFSGPLFVPEAIEDLELLTDILDVAGDPLSIVLAVASHVQRLPDGKSKLAPAVLKRLDRSLARLTARSSGAGASDAPAWETARRK